MIQIHHNDFASPRIANVISTNDRRGAATVEFALTLPLLLLSFLGLFELTRVALLKNIIDNASYEACRRVIVPGSSVAEAQAAAQSILDRYGVTANSILISPSLITDETSAVSVEIEVPALGNALGLSGFTSGLVLTGSTTLLTERSPTVQALAMPDLPPPPLPIEPPTPTPTPNPNPTPTPTPNPNPTPSPTPSPPLPPPTPPML